MNGYNRGLQAAFKQSNISNVIWVKTGKEECKLCDALDGIALDVNDASQLLPIHPKCQCYVIPKV